MFSRLFSGHRNRHKVATAAEFAPLLSRQAAFVSQKCTVEYCRARAGYNWDLLLKEAPFREALEACRWEGFALIGGDVGMLMEAFLRPHFTTGREVLEDYLISTYSEALREHPDPPSLRHGWAGPIEAFSERVRRARFAPPASPLTVSALSGPRIYDLLPIHPRLRSHDLELICNNLRFNLIRFNEDLPREVDGEAVAQDLLRKAAASPEVSD